MRFITQALFFNRFECEWFCKDLNGRIHCGRLTPFPRPLQSDKTESA